MQEYYRVAEPVIGNQYNAVIATHVTWDNILFKYRYFANPDDRRYIGRFIKSFHCEDGRYWEQYDRNGTLIKLDYDCEGTICLELVVGDVRPAVTLSEKIASIDSSIKNSPSC
jgi:hypothetical protein